MKAAVGALDRLARVLGRDNPDKLPEHLITGRTGEEAAYFYLRKQGYVIVARNWRSARHRGELDLVGWDGDVLCFVEVKTRTTRDVKPAEAAVDEEKRRDLSAVARDYRMRLKEEPPFRFDIVSMYDEGGELEITLFRNAFAAR